MLGEYHTIDPAISCVSLSFDQTCTGKAIKDAAEELRKRALRNDFDDLVIIAPPKALGVIKKELHKEVERRLLCTINKEMSARPIPDIEALIVNETKADEPAEV